VPASAHAQLGSLEFTPLDIASRDEATAASNNVLGRSVAARDLKILKKADCPKVTPLLQAIHV